MKRLRVHRKIPSYYGWPTNRCPSSSSSRPSTTRRGVASGPFLLRPQPSARRLSLITKGIFRWTLICLLLLAPSAWSITPVEDLRMLKRFGIGASAAGQLAMMGVEMDINFTESLSIGAAIGTGIDYSTAFLKARYYLSGQWVSPYFAAAVARWWSNGTHEKNIKPSVLANKFLEPGQNLSNGFDVWIASPGFGVQFMHPTGISFYAEMEYLFKLPNLINGTYAGLGVLWYF